MVCCSRQSAGKNQGYKTETHEETLAKNAKLGDGTFWKHTDYQRSEYKLVFSGVNKDWIAYKAGLLGRPVRLVREAGGGGKSGVFKNAKELWGTTSLPSKTYTRYRNLDKQAVLQELDLRDLAMWYLDDGCCIERRDYIRKSGKKSYRYFLCIGSAVNNTESEKASFLAQMSRITGTDDIGVVKRNGSKATDKNLVWHVPVPVGELLVREARKFGVSGFETKLRSRSLLG